MTDYQKNQKSKRRSLSKTSSFFIWLTFFLSIFIFGYSQGIWNKKRNLSKNEVVTIYTSVQMLKDPEILTLLELNESFKLKIVDIKNFEEISQDLLTYKNESLLIIPVSWAEKLKKENLIQNIKYPKNKISPTFEYLINKTSSFPLFWLHNQENKVAQLFVWSLCRPKNSDNGKNSELISQKMIQSNFMELLAKKYNVGFTLKNDELPLSIFQVNQRPQYLFEINLKKLEEFKFTEKDEGQELIENY